MGALVSGQMDICPMSGFGQVFAAVEKGAKLKILAGGAILPLQGLMSAKPNIKSVEDLVGKTVGTSSPGSLNNQLTVATMKKYGVDISKVNFVNIGSATDIFRAIAAGTVDAGSTEVWMDGRDGIHILDHARFWIDLPEYTYQAGFTAQSTIDSKRDVLVRTLAAYAKLYRFIQDPGSADAFVAAYASGMGKDDRAAAMQQWNFYQKYKPFDVDLVLSPQQLDYMQDRNLESGVQTKRVSFDDVADMSIARDAIKLIT
jgi:ABC-type nitrate/sulfonate/bicarbonate transport system substrate-binding protein